MLKKILTALSVMSLVAVLMMPVMVFAQDANPDATPTNTDQFGLGAVGGETGLSEGGGDLRVTIGNLIKQALGFLGVIAIIIVLIGGFKYMIAGGEVEKTKSARGWLISGIIGLAIILSAYAITSFILSRLQTATEASE
jgi:hypothetical protein